MQLHHTHLLLRALKRSQVEQLVACILVGDLVLQRIGQRIGDNCTPLCRLTLHRGSYLPALRIVQRDLKAGKAGQLSCQLTSAPLQKLLRFKPSSCIVGLLHPQIDRFDMLGERGLRLGQLIALYAAQHEIAQHTDSQDEQHTQKQAEFQLDADSHE
ncbi:hypothetical protein D3C81_1358340 [compost metagenome]